MCVLEAGKGSWLESSGLWLAPLTVGPAAFLNIQETLSGCLQVILSHLGDKRLNSPPYPLVFFAVTEWCPHVCTHKWYSLFKCFCRDLVCFLDGLSLSAAGLDPVRGNSYSTCFESKGETLLLWGPLVMIGMYWWGWTHSCLPLCLHEVAHDPWLQCCSLMGIWRVLNRCLARQPVVGTWWNVFPTPCSQVSLLKYLKCF